jgi:hypothetical protein
MKALTPFAILLALAATAHADPGRCGKEPVQVSACFRANASFRPRAEPPVCRRAMRNACVVARND